MANFGATFRKARDSKGISLERIADETRISKRFLEAIEKEELHILPGGIFNRGFVRTFAERIGLDPDVAVSEYEQLSKIQNTEPHVLPPEWSANRAGKNLYLVVVAVLALAIIIFYVVTRNSGAFGQSSVPTVAALPEPQPAAVLPQTPPVPPLTPPVEAIPEPITLPPTASMALEIEALERTWIRVVSDGSAPQQALMEAGNTLKFTAETSLTLRVGNAAGLVMKLNDQKMKSLGVSGQVREVVITLDNFNEFIG